MAQVQLEIPVRGMDCAECTHHVQRALAGLPGVQDVRVLLTSEKAVPGTGRSAHHSQSR